ncbi:zinc finger CCCH domain-containing protein 14 isoform X3 [Euwallacea fornicatus]|uniref:zinc finger CCCH domain-containing protein 14 isoform X3 n=1 Tax=Euwallacea fornicatus TaxID=995702 RepID=UPI00338E0F51
MESIGAEVGQKMRSAIKAKLTELECYVDDELPDYIMVMVANRRTKSQMNEDLNLFLSTKTSTFVNWLHIVLKKLKEVTVTNPDIYKKAIKRKSNELPDDKSSLKLKREKSHKKVKRESGNSEESNSLTDNLPLVNNLAATRKITVDRENLSNVPIDNFDIPLLSEVADSVNEQELQDIEKKIRNVKSRLGLLVESDEESSNVELKLENVNEANKISNERFIKVLENEILNEADARKSAENDYVSYTPERESLVGPKPKHKRIIFENNIKPSEKPRFDRDNRERSTEKDKLRKRSPIGQDPNKRRSILDRLGKHFSSTERSRSRYRHPGDRFGRSLTREREQSERYGRLGERNISHIRDRSPLEINDRASDRDKDAKKEGILNRLGVQSKVAVVKKPPPANKSDEEEQKLVVRDVQSAIKIKPRVIPSYVVQPNKTLLLKAVADAQRSVAQTPKVGKDPELQLNKSLNKKTAKLSRKLPRFENNKFQEIVRQSSNHIRSRLQLCSDTYDSNGEYIPQMVKTANRGARDVPNYVPSSKGNSKNETEAKENSSEGVTREEKQQFIITLDGADKLGFQRALPSTSRHDNDAKKRGPSPIIFDKVERTGSKKASSRRDIPDKLPIVRAPLSIKNKERCKYWPTCRHGDKCEFVHPAENCQMFPQCSYGDKCLFLHPNCKFGPSCTKRDCVYNHVSKSAISGPKILISSVGQTCKFYPNCTSLSCQFYHPKPCKYGLFCKNMGTCAFSHVEAVKGKSLSCWTAK